MPTSLRSWTRVTGRADPPDDGFHGRPARPCPQRLRRSRSGGDRLRASADVLRVTERRSVHLCHRQAGEPRPSPLRTCDGEAMETIDDVRAHLRAFLDGERGPRSTAALICAAALGRRSGQWPWLWLLWAVLGAACGTGRCAARGADEDMRRAAGEWLALSDDEAQWREYFDRWLAPGAVLRSGSGRRAGVVASRDGPARNRAGVPRSGADPGFSQQSEATVGSRRSARRRGCG